MRPPARVGAEPWTIRSNDGARSGSPATRLVGMDPDAPEGTLDGNPVAPTCL
jgi:hypothetical protein